MTKIIDSRRKRIKNLKILISKQHLSGYELMFAKFQASQKVFLQAWHGTIEKNTLHSQLFVAGQVLNYEFVK